MNSIQSQTFDIAVHHASYPAIDPAGELQGSAAGKVLFITGASQGIGRTTAMAFAQAGAAAVYLAARSEDNLRETQALVTAANPETQCAYGVCDVTDEDQVAAAIGDCVEQFGGIDVADANAGYLYDWRPIAESDPASWWRTWEVNIKGAYLVAHLAMPHLIASAKKHAAAGASGGHLILLSSGGAHLLMPGASDYQTSKLAVDRLCEFINVDHGGDGVKCFALSPGGVPTDLALNMPENVHQYLVDEPELSGGFTVWLCSGAADWAAGRYLSANWDVTELLARKDQILDRDLLVNRLRATE